MISETVVDLSRLQFAMTAMYHFLFVPLTLGLAFLLAIMESVYVMTGSRSTRTWSSSGASCSASTSPSASPPG